MTKAEFLATLRQRLNGLSQEDIAERVAFYSEAIDDRMEDGLTEEEAVEQMGAAGDIAARILHENVSTSTAPIKQKRQMSALVIILLILGSPVWISLLAAAFSIVISIYAVIWSIVVSVWSVGVALAASAIGCLAVTVLLFISGNINIAIAALAIALFCAGLSIFVFAGCKYVGIGAAILTKKTTLWIVGLFKRKDGAK